MPDWWGSAVLLPAPAENSGEYHGKGSTRAQTAILGRRQRLPRADLTEDTASHSGSTSCAWTLAARVGSRLAEGLELL